MLFAEVGRHLLSESHGLSGHGVGTPFEDRPLCFFNIASALGVDVGLPGRPLAHIASFLYLLSIRQIVLRAVQLSAILTHPLLASLSLMAQLSILGSPLHH